MSPSFLATFAVRFLEPIIVLLSQSSFMMVMSQVVIVCLFPIVTIYKQIIIKERTCVTVTSPLCLLPLSKC